MKKILCFFFFAVLLVLPLSAAEQPLLVDDAGLLGSEEYAALDAYLTEISETVQADVVVVTVDTLDGYGAQAMADDYFDYNGYGQGTDFDGVLFLLAMEERQWAVSTTGGGIAAFTDAALDRLESDVIPSLSSGDYYEAFVTYAELSLEFFTDYANGEPYGADYLTEPGYTPDYGYDSRYPAYPGETHYSSSVGFGVQWIFISLIGGFLIALIPMNMLKNQLHTVRMQSNAGQYLKDGSFRITGSRDLFLYRNLTRTPLPRDDDHHRPGGGGMHGGGMHMGSSGRSHGGRSGGF